MGVKIRLTRKGSNKNPFYRIVVADSRYPRDGRFIEQIGRYDPLKNPPEVFVKKERYDYWVKVGAKPSETVKQIIEKHGNIKS